MRVPSCFHFASCCLASACLVLLSGCSLDVAVPTATPDTGVNLQGHIFGGQQPVAGAQIYLLAANTTGYGGSGIRWSR